VVAEGLSDDQVQGLALDELHDIPAEVWVVGPARVQALEAEVARLRTELDQRVPLEGQR
jgi:hypothetical protein